jgi:hypothetical protein
MPTAYRLLGRAGGPIGDAETLDEVLESARAVPPGRYRLIKFYLDRATGELRCWEWGTITRGNRGELRLEIPRHDA